MANPWDRLEDETGEEFLAFCNYREQKAPRSVRLALGKDATKTTWHIKHKWSERVRAYDSHLDGLRLATKEEVIVAATRTITEQHLGLLSKSRGLLDGELTKHVKDSEASADAKSEYRIADIVKLLEAQVKLDRLVAGEATERIETVDLSDLTIEEVREVERASRLVTKRSK